MYSSEESQTRKVISFLKRLRD